MLENELLVLVVFVAWGLSGVLSLLAILEQFVVKEVNSEDDADVQAEAEAKDDDGVDLEDAEEDDDVEETDDDDEEADDDDGVVVVEDDDEVDNWRVFLSVSE